MKSCLSYSLLFPHPDFFIRTIYNIAQLYLPYPEPIVPAIAHSRKQVERPLMFRTREPGAENDAKVLDVKKGTP